MRAPRVTRFRSRLLLALLCVALVPTFVVTIATLIDLSVMNDQQYRPTADRALKAAVEVSRVSLTRIEATLLERADDWAAGLGPVPLDAARRAGLRDGLREAGLDLVQIYRRDEQHWVLRDHVAPAGVLTADALDFAAELDSALATDRLLRSPQGVFAGIAKSDSMTVLLTGVRLTPDYFARINEIIAARSHYGGTGILAQLWFTGLLGLGGLLAIAIAIIAFFVARTLAREMTRPLETMDVALGRVAAGDLETRVPESGAAEMRSLAASFNAMTARLAEARAGLVVAEREAAWRDVARKLAHEIKNPLTPMHLSLHRLRKRVDLVPVDQREVVRGSLDALLLEIEHLTQLADQFSQFARLPEPVYAPLDLSDLARAAVALHEPEHVAVRAVCERPVRVAGDRLLLSRAIHNLLLNAIEASTAGGTVEVRTGASDTEGWLEILDRGPGLEAGVAEKVFEPYVSTKNRGSGLGLSLVRDIAGQHNGRITLDNREGGGAMARLTLPLA